MREQDPGIQLTVASAAERLEVVGELASLINTTFDLDEIFPTAIFKIRRVLEFRRASVVLVTHDRSGYYLHTLYDAQAGGFVRDEAKQFPIDQGLTGQVISSGKAIRIDDFVGTSGIRTHGESRVSALIVPLRVDDQVIGTLNLGATESRSYNDADLELAVLLARQIETSLHYSKLLAQIQQQREALSREHERVTSERIRLEALIESSDAAILMVSDGRVAHANQAMAELLVLPREILVGASMDMVNKVLTRALADPSTLAAQQGALQRGDAELRDRIEFAFPHKLVCQRTIATVRGADDEVLGQLVLYRDVTREAEAEAAKSEFVSIVSHELRTPLTSVKTSLQLLTKGAAGSLSGKMRGLLDIALRNLERLIRLVDDLLDLSKIESGRMLAMLAPISLNDSVRGAVDAVKDFARERSITIDWVQSAADVFVMADQDRLQQVIVNLLSNAVKFSPPEGVVALRSEAEDNSVTLEIADQGPGIPPDQLEAIFDKFRQLERSATRRHGGAGLGLAISRTIAEQFGGELWAESEVGKGSRFLLRLRTAQASTASVERTARQKGPRRVLIVQKQAGAQDGFGDQFRQDGWHVTAESNGAEALGGIEQLQPDLIAVGVELDDMHGLEFLQRLRQIPVAVDIPTLLVGPGGQAGQAVSYGADGWLGGDPHALVIEGTRLVSTARRRLVLLVEDDPAVRVGLGRGLRRAGYACLEAASGEVAMELVRKRIPDIVVTDWRIPGKDGLALLREMREDTHLAAVPAIVVTGYADSAAVDAIKKLNAHLVPKPFSPSAIVREIDRLIGSAIEAH